MIAREEKKTSKKRKRGHSKGRERDNERGRDEEEGNEKVWGWGQNETKCEMFLSFFFSFLLFTLIDMKGKTKWGKRANERT